MWRTGTFKYSRSEWDAICQELMEIKQHNRQLSIKEFASKYNVTHITIHRKLKERGLRIGKFKNIPTRTDEWKSNISKGRAKDWDALVDEFVQRRNAGEYLRLDRYAKENHTSSQELRNIMKLHNIKLPVLIPKRTEDWTNKQSASMQKRIQEYGPVNPKGSNGKLKGKKKPEHSKKLKEGYAAGKYPKRAGMKGKHHSSETIKKLRLLAIQDIERKGPARPNYNPTACRLIEEYGKQHGYNFQHAENGGEYHIKELGYWVDGYDKEKNVVIEVYEPAHKFTIERDKQRQDEIEKHLSCKFGILYT